MRTRRERQLAAERVLGDAIALYGAAAVARVTTAVIECFGGARDARGLIRRGEQATKLAYIPGLTGKPWHELNSYASAQNAVSILRSHFGALREIVVSAVGGTLDNYNHSALSEEQNKHWRTIFFVKRGLGDAGALSRFPGIANFIEALGDTFYANGDVFLSVLDPRFRIPPHHDMVNYTLTLHFGIIIPPACGLRVGSEARDWMENEAFVFDQSFEHEAWNLSEHSRVCLLADLWHPEVTPPERFAIERLAPIFLD